MSRLCVKGGTVYDPKNGVDGEVKDIWIENGKVVEPPSDPGAKPDRTVDAAARS